ncbi:hypothetical protein Tco_0838329 [Tanacetum coccineum]|uniref:Uncharacterized protein n=1 Tax=Tanacetum coccineum TaxID=301880 RepID=A0ABQ5AQT0_9ASTR
MVNEGISLYDSLVFKESTNVNTTSSEQKHDESSNSWYDADSKNARVNTTAFDIDNVDVRPSYARDTLIEDNSNIISNTPDMDPNRGDEDHDNVENEQERALFVSIVNNLKCEVEKCNKVNREAKQANDLLTKEIKRYTLKEKHFVKDKTTESKYCKRSRF